MTDWRFTTAEERAEIFRCFHLEGISGRSIVVEYEYEYDVMIDAEDGVYGGSDDPPRFARGKAEEK